MRTKDKLNELLTEVRAIKAEQEKLFILVEGLLDQLGLRQKAAADRSAKLNSYVSSVKDLLRTRGAPPGFVDSISDLFNNPFGDQPLEKEEE